MSIYIAGPMTGIKDFNYPAFNDAAVALRGVGFTVLNPVDAEHYNPDWPTPQAWDWYMRYAIRMVTKSTKMALLPGWEKSAGANLEHTIAMALKLDIRTLDQWLRPPDVRGISHAQGELNS